MKFLRQGIALTVLGAGLAASPGLAAQAAPTAPSVDDRSVVQKMQDSADGSVTINTEKATGRVGFVRAGLNGDLLEGNTKAPVAKADAYLDKFATAFGATRDQLVQDEVTRSEHGSVVSYVQKYQGIPVFGSLLRVHFDDEGALTAVNGELVPVNGLSTDTRLTAQEAGQRAVRLVKAQPPGEDGKADTSGIEAKNTTLEVYRHGLVQGVTGKTELVYQVEVTNKKNIRDMVFVAAASGKVVNRYSMVHDALDREFYEADQDRNLTLVWEEGDPFPGSLNEDQQSMVQSTGEAYWLFKNAFGRDSYDGAGHVMRTVNNDPAIACPNANWNGATTNYCDGVSSDDVVAHEWGHAYTEYTHGLIYQWQSGALNESYSDIWGETVDLVNGRLDEGEGDLEKKRPVGQCSKYTRGAISATINSPAPIAGPCEAAAAASFGPVFDKAGTTTDVVVGQDPADASGPSTTDGCSPLTNGADVAGKFVFIDRGTCTFSVKIGHAEDAGATGIVVGDSVAGRAPISMSGVSDIYGLMVTKGDGDKIKSAAGPVNMTIRDSETAPKVDSYRWLMGEKSDAFGGAIRDMWNPTCYGDPGKVSDAEYFCDSEDGGGVHSNSGVPNHGYALLVDGGTYNGTTVQGIGIDKAANIYFKAMTDYQTPVSNFADHANALEASCRDLTGRAINKITTEENSTTRLQRTITSTDCAQVTAMIKAVELRKDPVQCGFQPLLDKNTPAICGSKFSTETVFSEDFEDGLAGWTLTGENPYDGLTFDWEATSDYNGDHTSRVAYGPDPDAGDCSGTETDASSANYMTSGDITVPATATAPRMSFEHYIATEGGYDGGNVQLSVNGGTFAPIAADAYTFNAPGNLATAAEGSTNPLEGQPGFTGTDPGKSPVGSWGTSQVDLAAAGVTPGDTVQLRFAMGRDGCGGVDGWYVDNVKVVNCVAKKASKTVSTPVRNPVRFRAPIVVANTVTVAGGTPTGKVQIWWAGKRVGTGTLNDAGKVRIRIDRDIAAGKRTFTAKYLGSSTVLPSSDKFTVRITR